MTNKKNKFGKKEFLREREYLSGLPFTIDFKKMFEKTITSRFAGNDQDIIELIKLGIENSDSYVNINENKQKFSVEFDGGGVSSEDDLINLILGIYSNKSKNYGPKKLERLGTALLASLSKKPLEIIVETHNDGTPICMEIDNNFKPRIFKPDYPTENNKITIIKKNATNPKRFYNYFRNTTVKKSLIDLVNITGSGIASGYNLLRHPIKTLSKDKNKENSIEKIAVYTDKEIKYNKKKLNKGFKFEDVLFQKEYQMGGSRIVLSIPKKNSSSHQDKKTTFLKNFIPLETRMTAHYPITDEIYLHRRKNDFIIQPNIIIENPSFELNISNDGVIRNENFNKIEKDINLATKRFWEDFILGDLDMPYIEPYSKEDKEVRIFVRSVLWDKLIRNNLECNIKEYVNDKKAYLSKLPEYKTKELEKFFSIKFFRDIDNRMLSIPEMYKTITDNSYKISYLQKAKFNRNHPALRGKIGANEPVLFFESKIQKELFDSLFTSDSSSITGEKRRINASCIDRLIDEYEMEELERQRERRRKIGNAVKRSAVTTGVTTGMGAIGTATYYVVPFIWNAGMTAVNFLFLTHPEITLLGGSSVLGTYAVAKVASKAYKGTKYAVTKSTEGIKEGYNLSNEFLKDNTQNIDDAVGGVWGKFKNNVIKKPFYLSADLFNYSVGSIKRYMRESRHKKERKPKKIKKPNPPKIKKERYLKGLDARHEDYLDYLIGRIERSRINPNYDVFSDINLIEITKKRGKPFNLNRNKDNNMVKLEINTSSKNLKKRIDYFYASGGRTLFSDLQDIATILVDNYVKLRPDKYKLNKNLLSELYKIEVENIFNMYKSCDENFQPVLEKLDEEGKKYVLKRIIEGEETNSNNQSNEQKSRIALEEWLIDKYNLLLEEVSEQIISGKEFEILENMKGGKEAIPIFEKLSPNEKIKYITDNIGKQRIKRDISGSILESHIMANYPLLIYNLELQDIYNNPTIKKIIDAYESDDICTFHKLTDPSNQFSIDNTEYLYLQILHNGEEKTNTKKRMDDYLGELANSKEIFHKGKEKAGQTMWSVKELLKGQPFQSANIILNNNKYSYYSSHDTRSNNKRYIHSILDLFYKIPESKKKEYLSRARRTLIDNPYFSHFVKTIKESHPQYTESISAPNIII